MPCGSSAARLQTPPRVLERIAVHVCNYHLLPASVAIPTGLPRLTERSGYVSKAPFKNCAHSTATRLHDGIILIPRFDLCSGTEGTFKRTPGMVIRRASPLHCNPCWARSVQRSDVPLHMRSGLCWAVFPKSEGLRLHNKVMRTASSRRPKSRE
jgi:hypothetical protein